MDVRWLILIVEVCVAAIVGTAIVRRWLRGLHVDAYTEGQPGLWETRECEHTGQTTTIGGFKVFYTVSATFTRIDNKEFRTWRMLDEARCSRIFALIHTDCVRPLLFPPGNWFLRFRWSTSGEPGVSAYRCDYDHESWDYDRGCWQEAYDPNGCRLIDAANAKLKSLPNTKSQICGGCQVVFSKFKMFVYPETIEENFKMISADTHAKAEQFLELQKVKEAAVVKALKLRLDLAQNAKGHTGRHYTVKTALVGTVVTIGWELNKNKINGRGNYRLLGFRRTDGFQGDNPFDDESKNGQQVVDSWVSDSCVDDPPPGLTHYYTFFLQPLHKDGIYEKYDLVRFQIHVPAENDLSMLKRLLDESRVASQADDRSRSARAKLLEPINVEAEKRELLMKYWKDKCARIRADDDFDDAQKQQLLKALAEDLEDEGVRVGFDQ